MLRDHTEDAADTSPRELARLRRLCGERLFVDDLERELLESTAARLGIPLCLVNARVRREIVFLARAREHINRNVEASLDMRAQNVSEIRVGNGVPLVGRWRKDELSFHDLRPRLRRYDSLVDGHMAGTWKPTRRHAMNLSIIWSTSRTER